MGSFMRVNAHPYDCLRKNSHRLSQVTGSDLDCGAYYPDSLQNAVMQGEVADTEIDKSLKELHVVLMRLGFFDGSPFKSLCKDHVCSNEHIELAAEAAREGVVLLKNVNETLPLDSAKFKNIAVIGPHANSAAVMVSLADMLHHLMTSLHMEK